MKKLILLFLVISIGFAIIHAQTINNPVSNTKAQVVEGNARFTVLTPELIRMEWSVDGAFQNNASIIFINRDLAVPAFKKSVNSGVLTITTSKLTLKYKLNSDKFTSKNLEVKYLLGNSTMTWKPGDTDSQNLKGTSRTLDGYNGEIGWSNQKLPIEDGIISRSGWSLINDTMPLFDGNKDWNWVMPRPEKEYQDWYFFGYGHNYSKALKDYTSVAGKIPMPPLYAFGYWWCRYWSYSDSEMKELVTNMKLNDIPIDVAIVDMDWHKTVGLNSRKGWGTYEKNIMGQREGWGDYSWNKDLFPSPEKFLDWMEKNQVKNALNLHPASGVLNTDFYYPAMAKSLGLDTTKNTAYDREFAKKVGWDTVSIGNNIPWDITNKKFATSYFDVIIRDLEKQGVDFWWLDWQSWKNTPVKNLNNIWWINYCFFTDMERNTPNRPFLFHRWGGLGNHRYQIGFSGDTFSTWSSLDFQKYFTANAANVGYGYWSHDIGGHIFHKDFDPELYTRWVQYGVFSPILRTHGTKRPETDRRIWAYPYENYVQMKKAIELRYALLPYIYTASRNAYDTGLSICLPLYYKHSEVDMAYKSGHEYYFGDDIIASPISDSISISNLLAPIKIWLPEGKWFDYSTGEIITGNRSYNRSYSLSQIPIFMKSGSIIPMYPPMSNTQNLPDTLILTVVPGSKGSMRFYDDAGNDTDYMKDKFTWIKADQTTTNNIVHIKIEKPVGNYQTHVKSYRIDMLNTLPPTKATYNGESLTWSYDATNLTTHINIPSYNLNTVGNILIEFKNNLEETNQLLSGTKGRMDALSEVLPKLKEALGAVDVGAMPSLLNNLSQMATRIQYNPNLAENEFRNFNSSFLNLESEIEKMDLDDNNIRPLINRLKNCYIEKPNFGLSEKSPYDKPFELSLDVENNVGGAIFYTTDNSVPNELSACYSKPILISESSNVKAVNIKDKVKSEIVSKSFMFIPAKSIISDIEPLNGYEFNRLVKLMDGENGDPTIKDEKWICFDKNFTLTIELKKPQSLNNISLGAIQGLSNVTLPSEVEVRVSGDGKKYRLAGKLIPDVNEAISKNKIYREELSINTNDKEVRFVQIAIKTAGILSFDHPRSAGKKSMVFLDEISIR